MLALAIRSVKHNLIYQKHERTAILESFSLSSQAQRSEKSLRRICGATGHAGANEEESYRQLDPPDESLDRLINLPVVT